MSLVLFGKITAKEKFLETASNAVKEKKT